MRQNPRPEAAGRTGAESFSFQSRQNILWEDASPDQSASPDDIRRMSNLLCFFLLFYYLSRQIFQLPLTYGTHLLGFDVRINPFTGMIVLTDISRAMIAFFTGMFSLLIVLLLVLGFYHRPIAEAHLLRRPYPGLFPLALPITLSCGMLGVFFSLLFERLFQLFGLVIYTAPQPVYQITPLFWVELLTGLCFGIFQEFLFRGVLLTPLRRFGDGFAIIASAMLFALWTDGAIEAVFSFVFGVCAAYFVIRSGSVYTAVFSRSIMLLLICGFRLLSGMAGRLPAQEICLGGVLLLSLWALTAYLRFLHLDQNAFRLVRPAGSLSTRMRLSSFCGSIGFVLLLLAMLYRVSKIVQIIG